ncbi:MAG: YgfZ/GcvT domain-containing protein [Acidimicrobiales bacterium]
MADVPSTTAPTPEGVAGYRAVRDDAGVIDLPRDFVSVAGPDAERFLEGQLSQDVAAIPSGGSAWALLLQPQGKMVALLRVTRTGGDVGAQSFVLDTDAGFGAAVMERLVRFKLRVRCDIEALDWRCIAVRGPRSHEAVATGEGLAASADWPGLNGADLIGDAPVAPAGVLTCPKAAWEAVRIEAGIPAMGRELDERTIPAEAGVVGPAVSFTKGCYTGQELVARIDSRGGNVPRHLCGVIMPDGVRAPAGAALRADGRDVGALTSVAWSPGRGVGVALAYVGRAVTPPAEVELSWEGGSALARVEPLPLAT